MTRTDKIRPHRRSRLRRLFAALLSAPLLAAAACAPGGQQSDAVIDYWLWESSQQPGYQQCADAFAAANPGQRVRITQLGWAEYWQKLTAGFIADQAPDVFTNHLSRYAQFVDLGVLRPLDELAPTSTIVDDDFQPGLADLWKGPDGHRYGVPKDWDTVGLFYDPAVLAEAGVDPEELSSAAWNPTDGGTFERLLARLSVDANGVRGDEPGFDPNNVAVYGISSAGGGGMMGQTTWSAFAGSTGWRFADTNPWGRKLNYDRPEFVDTIEWYFGLAQKGLMPRYGSFSTETNPYQQLASQRVALALDGAWQISSYVGLESIDVAVAPTPIGPSGRRASPYNGLADSVTTMADDPEAAAKWVAFLGSDTCQDLVGDAGVVFPARNSGTERSLAARQAAGLDVTALTQHVSEQTTFLLPAVSHSADIEAIMTPGLEAIYIGDQPASSLIDLNRQLDVLFELG